MPESNALFLVARLSGFIAILQSLELIASRSWMCTEGVWSWQTLRKDYADQSLSIRSMMDRYLNDQSFPWVLGTRVLIAVAVTIHPEIFGLLLLLVSGFLTSARFRGAFNGGSDSMTLLTLASLCVGFVMPGSVAITRLALELITGQVVLSYFVAGVHKLKQNKWRSGKALAELVKISPLRTSSHLPLNWATRIGLLFECGFPLVFVSPSFCTGFLAAGVVFHWINHRVFGLNRFFWAWVITYPAIVTTVQLIHR